MDEPRRTVNEPLYVHTRNCFGPLEYEPRQIKPFLVSCTCLFSQEKMAAEQEDNTLSVAREFPVRGLEQSDPRGGASATVEDEKQKETHTHTHTHQE